MAIGANDFGRKLLHSAVRGQRGQAAMRTLW
jgi:hypothetical protein